MDYGNIVAANLMLKAGVRVYMYSGFTHAKALVVDGWAIVGTANLDRLSLRVNQEVNLATSHPPAVEALLDELFAPDFLMSAELTAPLDEPLSYSLAEFIANGL
jgi:cardiolipin synthase